MPKRKVPLLPPETPRYSQPEREMEEEREDWDCVLPFGFVGHEKE